MNIIFDCLKMMGIGIIIFIYAIFLLRIAKSRVRLERPFDFVIIILIGSLLSRTINGSADLIPTLVTTLLLIFAHSFLSWLTYHFDWVGNLFKGNIILLVSDGEINWSKMKQCKITKTDLLEEARKNKVFKIEQIKKAYLERDGKISFIHIDE